jgi:hypothetical protein
VTDIAPSDCNGHATAFRGCGRWVYVIGFPDISAWRAADGRDARRRSAEIHDVNAQLKFNPPVDLRMMKNNSYISAVYVLNKLYAIKAREPAESSRASCPGPMVPLARSVAVD